MAYENFDLIVIGSGPAGYTAAIRAAQLGFKTACIEKDKTLGGTCLNVGCIPSKALLESSEHYHQAKTKYSKHGIMIENIKVDLGAMLKRKDGIVRQLTGGVAGLFKKNKVESVPGLGVFKKIEGDLKIVEAKSESGTRTLAAPRVLIATGSVPNALPFLPFDGKTVISSTEALSLPTIPKHLVVIGGGVIGLELGSVWARLGARVTVIEFMDRIVPMIDHQISNELYKSLQKQGLEFRLATKCLGATQKGGVTIVQTEEIATGTKSQIECDVVLVATGRKPTTQWLGLEAIGLTTNKIGQIEVDEHYRTPVAGVYAVGDVIPGPMLAHKGEEEGIAAVELMAGQAGHVNYAVMPNVIYTWPELATVGASEEELKEAGVPYKVGTFPFMANGRAKSMEESEGLVKIIAHAQTDKVLGVHIVGARASDMLPEAVAVMEFEGSAEDIARTTHAHPTLSEIMKEAALAVDKRQINL
jgi:dihydrolipoamide dehydrogenase